MEPNLLTILTAASFLILVTERIAAALLAPVRLRWPALDLWWVIYPTWILGGLLAWVAGLNLFTLIIVGFDPTVGRILTAIVVGGGSNLLHDILARPNTIRVTAETPVSQSSQITATADNSGMVKADIKTEAKPAEPAKPIDG